MVLLNVSLVVTIIPLSLFVDAIVMSPDSEGLTLRLLVKAVAYVVASQGLLALHHRLRRRS